MKEENFRCPEHNVVLKKKPIMYGLPDPNEDYSGVILGGCCIPFNAKKYGYECPVDGEVYYLEDDEPYFTEDDEEND
jgi:hypothetical protein